MDLVRAGNDRAFEAIVLRYHRQLLRHCRRLLPAGRAEDAVQQALLRALEAMRADQRELQLGPWLHRIAHNTAIDSLRRLDSHWEELDERMDGVEPTHAAVERRARFDSVVSSMGDLPERQRRALVLRELEGRSYEEIAATLGVTGAGVRQLLNRARNSMRAAASSLVPPAFVARLAGSQTGVRVAELVDPPGTSALMAKAAAAMAAGAVALLAVNGPPSGDRDHQSRAKAATPPAEVEKRPDRARAARTVAATTEVARPRSRQRRAAEPARGRRGEGTARSRRTSRRGGASPGGGPAVQPVQQDSAPRSRRGASIGGVVDDDDAPGTRVAAGVDDGADDDARPVTGGGGGGGDDDGGGGGGGGDDTGTTTAAPPAGESPAGGDDSGDDAPAPTSDPAPTSAPAPTSVPTTQPPAALAQDDSGGELDEAD